MHAVGLLSVPRIALISVENQKFLGFVSELKHFYIWTTSIVDFKFGL